MTDKSTIVADLEKYSELENEIQMFLTQRMSVMDPRLFEYDPPDRTKPNDVYPLGQVIFDEWEDEGDGEIAIRRMYRWNGDAGLVTRVKVELLANQDACDVIIARMDARIAEEQRRHIENKASLAKAKERAERKLYEKLKEKYGRGEAG